MIQVLLLHLTVIILAMTFAKVGVHNNRRFGVNFKLNEGYLISFFILVMFLGFRVGVGRDIENYERIYTSIFQQDFSLGESREFGFLALVSFLRSLDLNFQFFVLSTTFLMLFLFYISYRKFYYLLPLAIFVFFTDWGYTVTINTIRQGIALMAFLNATLYIDSHDKHSAWKFLFFMGVGLLFHYSILIFLPFYYIGRLKLKTIYFIMGCLLIFSLSIFVIMPLYEDTISIIDKYESYANDTNIVNKESSFGLGAMLVLLIRLAPISIYAYVKKNNPAFLKYFVLYFIGLSLYYSFYKFMLITRVTFYLQFMELFVISYFIYFLFVEKKKYRLVGVGYVAAILFNYIYTFQDFLADQLASNRFSLMFMDYYYKL